MHVMVGLLIWRSRTESVCTASTDDGDRDEFTEREASECMKPVVWDRG